MKNLSIIIPLYNKEKYIIQCIESIIKCKYLKEVIVINDGSTDESYEVLMNYINDNEYKNLIKVYSQKNTGPSNARNVGIEKSNSKYTVFLDADDFFVEDSIEQLIELAEEKNYDMIEFDFCNENENANDNKINKKYYTSNIEIIKDMLNKKNIKPVVCGTLFKTSICKQCKFVSDMKWGEDSCYKLDYVLKIDKALYISKKCYVNRILFDNTLSRQKISHEMVDSVIKYIDYYDYRLNKEEKIEKYLYNRLFKTCVSYLKQCIKTNKDEYKKEILNLINMSKKYKKYIKFNSWKHLMYYIYIKQKIKNEMK